MKKVLAAVAVAVAAVGALSMKAPQKAPPKLEQVIDAWLHELLTQLNARHAAR